jgi:hypothetical protein
MRISMIIPSAIALFLTFLTPSIAQYKWPTEAYRVRLAAVTTWHGNRSANDLLHQFLVLARLTEILPLAVLL